MPIGIYPMEKRKNLFKKGHKHSKEVLAKISKSNMGHKPPKTAFKKGQRPSKKTEFKKGELAKNWNGFKKGEDNLNWVDGKSMKYSSDWTETLKISIRERDNFICQECGIHQDELIGWNKKLDIHHIDYDKDNCNPKNLITLCRSCHTKTNIDRDKWIEYFKEVKW